MKDSKLFTYAGLISALLTIGDCSIRAFQTAHLTFSPFSIITLIFFIICIVMKIILFDVNLYYNIKKRICYYIRKQDSYLVKNKECIYIFKSRTDMEYIKSHDIVSNVANLKHFCDKFKWSKEQSVDEINIKCANMDHKVSVDRVENWHQYTVEFEELGKGQEQQVKVIIGDLHDPNKESLLFLSSNVACKTKKLRLVVVFKDETLKPKCIKYKIFDNYASNFPLLQEDLSYDSTECKIEKIEEMPIYGYRYEITWKFEDDN